MVGSAVVEWIIRALVGLGVGVVTYEGLDVSLNWLKSQALSNAFALGPQIVGMLSVLKVGQCINIVLSAIAVKFAVNGVASGRFKKFVKK